MQEKEEDRRKGEREKVSKKDNLQNRVKKISFFSSSLSSLSFFFLPNILFPIFTD